MADAAKNEPPVIIKKYPNRRLYNTETSMYVTLDDLADLVREGRDFQVQDAKTGDDLTRQVLTQIIFEMESRGAPLLPTEFLRTLIGFYDNKMGGVLQHYLNASMKTFLNNQERLRTYATRAMQEISPLSQIEEFTRQNVSFFEKTFTMFNPFGAMMGGRDEKEDKKKK